MVVSLPKMKITTWKILPKEGWVVNQLKYIIEEKKDEDANVNILSNNESSSSSWYSTVLGRGNEAAGL